MNMALYKSLEFFKATEGLCEYELEATKVSMLSSYVSKVQSFHLLFQSNEIHFHTRPNWPSLSLKTAPRWLMKEAFLEDLIHLVEIFEIDKIDLARYQSTSM